ncbi:MAG: hypothetical protein QM764_20685 [Chitinophagaceae bacterium]
MKIAIKLQVINHFQELKARGYKQFHRNKKSVTMNIKNCTSTIDATRSMSKIEDLLVEIGATDISKQYSEKVCTGITFRLPSL